MRQQQHKGLVANERELRSIIRRAGMAHECVHREVPWEWPLSRVERVHLDGDGPRCSATWRRRWP